MVSFSTLIVQEIPVRLLRRALVHAQVEVAGGDQPVVAQDLFNMPNGAAVKDGWPAWKTSETQRRARSFPEIPMISFSCRARTRLSVLMRLRACPNARGTGNLEKCIKVN